MTEIPADAGLFGPECPHHFDCDGIKCQPEIAPPAVPVVHPEPGDRPLVDQVALKLMEVWATKEPGSDAVKYASNGPFPVGPAWAATFADMAAAAVAAVRADRDRLAGQVAAIRALCDEWDAEAQETWTSYSEVNALGFSRAAHGIRNDAQALDAKVATARAALVASSPTTPEATDA